MAYATNTRFTYNGENKEILRNLFSQHMIGSYTHIEDMYEYLPGLREEDKAFRVFYREHSHIIDNAVCEQISDGDEVYWRVTFDSKENYDLLYNFSVNNRPIYMSLIEREIVGEV